MEKGFCSPYTRISSHPALVEQIVLEGLWYVTPDDDVLETQTPSLIDLAECGVPLSALGIRARLHIPMNAFLLPVYDFD
jgi:hypothetical protein